MTTSIKITNEDPSEITLEVLSDPVAGMPIRKVLNTAVISPGDFCTSVVARDSSAWITLLNGARETGR